MKTRIVAAVAAVLLVPMPGQAHSSSEHGLPSVASGHRPGPDALYLPAPDAPQLQNAGIWTAEPILVSGAVSYRDGEFVAQDFLYDDHGAAGIPDPTSPWAGADHLFSPVAGTFTYPTDPVYAGNAADIVEWRLKPLDDATAFRVTMNTMLATDRVAVTLALGGIDDGPLSARAWPFGAGVRSPADVFVTAHAGGAAATDAASGQTLSPAPSVSIDQTRRQIEILVPHQTWNPGLGSARVSVGAGLWDGDGYLAPRLGIADETTPGGASPLGAAIVNVAPRLDEPLPDLKTISTWTLADSAVGAAEQARWWRERAQADALRLGDVTAFHANVDFAKLADGIDDDSRVPQVGPINRILASRYATGQGLDLDGGARLAGTLQPYALYVPDTDTPEAGWGLTLLMHSLSANQNQYSASRNQWQFGDADSLVVTPSGRGPDGFYAGIHEADAFETWADVARRYPVDPDRAVASGYSMGGFGTYRMLARWPDLFSGGFSVVGIPGDADPMLANLRHTPIVTWTADGDELVNLAQTEAAITDLTALGLRFTSWLFLTSDHLTLATNDEYTPGVADTPFGAVDRDPHRVTYVVNPGEDHLDLVADHAYWLSDLRLRDAGKPTGTIDVASAGFGIGDSAPQPVEPGAGALLGGNHGPMPYLSRTLAWSEPPATPVADRLVIHATNIASVTIDPVRARVSCDAELVTTSDGPLTVTLAGC